MGDAGLPLTGRVKAHMHSNSISREIIPSSGQLISIRSRIHYQLKRHIHYGYSKATHDYDN